MKRIAIFSLTRFGDLIQTTPVLSGLRRRHPDAELHLILKSRFRPVVELLPHVDRVHEIDGNALARALTTLRAPWLERYRAAERVVEALEGISFDLALNFTHSRTSAVLLSLLDARDVRGFTLDREGQRRVYDPWLRYMSVLVRARPLARLNLVDVYLGAVGLAGQGERLSVRVRDSARVAARALLPGDAPRVALQLGASLELRTWEVERYAEALRVLARRVPGVRFALVGVAAEAARAQALVGACPELAFDDLVARTDFSTLAAALERVRLLLTGDTGTMHLAAAVGTPTLSLFLGPAYPHETGPYGEGHLVVHSRIACAPCSHGVACGFPACHGDVPPAWLGELAARVALGEPAHEVDALPRADLLRSEFDEDGFWRLAPVHRHARRPSDALALAYRAAFLESFGGPQAAPARIRELAERWFAPGADEPHAIPAHALETLAALEELGKLAADTSAELARPGLSAARISDAGRRLRQIDERVAALGRAEPLVAPLALALDDDLRALPEADLPALAAASETRYRALARRAAVTRAIVAPGAGAPLATLPLTGEQTWSSSR
jgi:ADP-heptose:LPS heptosyltransferase